MQPTLFGCLSGGTQQVFKKDVTTELSKAPSLDEQRSQIAKSPSRELVHEPVMRIPLQDLQRAKLCLSPSTLAYMTRSQPKILTGKRFYTAQPEVRGLTSGHARLLDGARPLLEDPWTGSRPQKLVIPNRSNSVPLIKWGESLPSKLQGNRRRPLLSPGHKHADMINQFSIEEPPKPVSPGLTCGSLPTWGHQATDSPSPLSKTAWHKASASRMEFSPFPSGGGFPRSARALTYSPGI